MVAPGCHWNYTYSSNEDLTEDYTMLRLPKGFRMGISARVSIITAILLVVILGIMLLIVSQKLDDDVHQIQIESFDSEVNAIESLVGFQTKLVERILRAHILNSTYTDSVKSGNLDPATGLLRILNSNLQILDAALIVDTSGTVIAAAADEHVGVSIRSTRIWQEIAGGAAYPADYIPSESPFTGNPVIYYAVRLYADRQELGTLIAVLDLRVFSSIYLSNLQFGETGYPIVVTNEGITVSHPNSGLIGEDISSEDFYIKIQEEIEQDNNEENAVNYTYQKREKALVFRPLMGDTGWIAAVTMDEEEIQAPTISILKVLMGSGLIAAILMIAVLTVFIRLFLIRRVHSLAQLLQVASTGNLTVEIPEKGNDEFSDISRRFNRLVHNLVLLIQQVRERMNVLESGGHDLSANVQQTAAAINQINANIESTRGQIANQSVNITETSATVEEMTKNIESLGASIEKQSESVSQSSSAVEEMVQSVRLISSTTEKAAGEVRVLEDVSRNGKEQLDNMVNLINDISGMSDALGEANTVIANIASQTNLLAMNAAIEAAHAGDAGAGFSVVADEIRNLAENASDQAKIVKGRLKDVTQAVKHIVDISAETDKAFGRIAGSISGVQQIFEEIRSAMGEQASGGEELLSILSGMTDITTTVRSGSVEMNQGNTQIIEVITSLNAISQEVKNAIEEIARGTGEINKAIASIVDLSDENTESIQQVQQETKKFYLSEEEVLESEHTLGESAGSVPLGEEDALDEQDLPGLDSGEETDKE